MRYADFSIQPGSSQWLEDSILDCSKSQQGGKLDQRLLHAQLTVRVIHLAQHVKADVGNLQCGMVVLAAAANCTAMQQVPQSAVEAIVVVCSQVVADGTTGVYPSMHGLPDWGLLVYAVAIPLFENGQVARLLALSYGEKSLSRERWQQMRNMEDSRMGRLDSDFNQRSGLK